MKVKLNTLLDQLHGKLDRDDENGTITVFRNKNGKQEAYTMKKQSAVRTPAQKAHTALFNAANRQARTIYDDPTQRQQWQQQYNASEGIIDGKKCASLLSYISRSIYQTLKQQAKSNI